MSKIDKIWSTNEWGKLKEILIGDPTGAFVPDYADISARSFDRPKPEALSSELHYSTPPELIQETLEDIEELSTALRKLGVIVHRSIPRDFTQRVKSPDWDVYQESGINLRDLTLIHGNLIIDTPSPTRNRTFESLNMRPLFHEYIRKDRSAWFVSTPKPQLLDATYDLSNPVGIAEIEPLFDAANCVRMGRDIVIDINNTANVLGADWIQQALDKHYGARKVTVHKIKCSPDHLDVILIPLREGTFLVNPDYVKPNSIPEAFKKWEVLVSPQMEHQSYGIRAPKASNWIGLNVLVVDGEKRQVIVEKRQHGLIKLLEKADYDVLPLSWRHGRTWGGGFHCVTLDLHREAEL